MISRASLFALTASGALHAAVLSNWHTPFSIDPASIPNFENNLDVQIIEDANTIGDIPTAAQASIDSQSTNISPVEVNEREQALIHDVKRLSETIFSLEKQFENAHHQAQNANHEIEQLTSTKASLEETLEAVHRSANMTKAGMSEQISILKAENRQSQIEKADLQAQKNQAQFENTELRSANLSLSDLLSDARDASQQSRNELVLERAHSQALDHQLNALNTQQETLETSHLDIQREANILSEQNHGLVIENTTLKSQKNQAQSENTELRSANLSLSDLLSDARDASQQSQKALVLERAHSQALDHQLMALNTQQETLEADRLSIERETNSLREQNHGLVIENTTLKSQNSMDREAIQSLQNVNSNLKHILDQTKKEMTELQAKLEKSLQTSRASLATGNAMDESNPTPAAGNPKPIYPKIAIRRGIEGDVSLRVMLTASGVVSSVTVEKPSGSRLLDAAAVSAVKKWQFNPAMHQGEPAASVTTVPIEFKLIQSRG